MTTTYLLLYSVRGKSITSIPSNWNGRWTSIRYLPIWSFVCLQKCSPHFNWFRSSSSGLTVAHPQRQHIPPSDFHSIQLGDYREQLMLTLSSARELAASNIQRAQLRYKEQYDRGARPSTFKLGEWVFLKFPQDESDRPRKLSRRWH